MLRAVLPLTVAGGRIAAHSDGRPAFARAGQAAESGPARAVNATENWSLNSVPSCNRESRLRSTDRHALRFGPLQ